MANQQRSVIVTAIVLAVILGGALVWLLNRTPATQLATQVPSDEGQTQTESSLQTQETSEPLLAQAQPQPTSTPLSPTEPQGGAIQGVSATAPTGPAQTLALVSISLGSGGMLSLLLARFYNLRS